MKKIVAQFLVFVLLFCLSACGKAQHKEPPDSNTSNETHETTTEKATTSTPQAAAKDAHKLTASHIIDRIKTYSRENNLDPVSDIETKPGEKEGQFVTSFGCINGLVNVSVTETNGVVDYIISLCLPTQVIKKVPSDSLAEAAVGAYAYSMIPLLSCEPEIDNRWHQEQFSKAPDEGDASTVIRSYTSKEWYYTAMVSEVSATCVAARYCSQCKSNAPKVTFFSGSQICDICNYNNQIGKNSDSSPLVATDGESVESTNNTEFAGGSTQKNGATETTGYQPGNWTMFEYSSEWLNMSFKAAAAFKASNENIEITKLYNAARRLDDPNSSIIEMEFGWSNESNKGTPIMMTVEPLTGEVKDLSYYADEKEQNQQQTYNELKIERKVVETSEEKIIFCGESWLKRYTKTSVRGSVKANCSLYRIIDGYLVCLSYEDKISSYNEKYFFSCFSKLDDLSSDNHSDVYQPKPESVTIPEIEPEKETVPAPIPTNKVPYTTPLAGSTEIYKEPDSSSKYVQDIGKKGVFTIVKEAYDSSGNLWGKLKSGLGWVLLKKGAVAPARTCSQCGMAEPDTYFADDWQEGDLCDACNYDNFNAGEEKLICKSCGEDCTYIGLEEDGRCEDCHSK